MQDKMTNGDRQAMVSAAAWPRTGSSDMRNPAVSGADRRQASIQACVITCAGLVVMRFWKQSAGIAMLCVGVVILCSGWFAPAVYSVLRRFGGMAAKWVGCGLTWLLLLPFFYVCFTLGRIVLLVCRRDPLQREFNTGKASYWVKREPVTDIGRYERQF